MGNVLPPYIYIYIYVYTYLYMYLYICIEVKALLFGILDTRGSGRNLVEGPPAEPVPHFIRAVVYIIDNQGTYTDVV